MDTKSPGRTSNSRKKSRSRICQRWGVPIYNTGEMNEMFIAVLIKIYEVDPKLFPLDIDEPNDLYN